MKRVAAVLALIGAGGWYAALPPEPLRLSGVDGPAADVRGAIHVHTNRSDGTGTVESVAAAAARAGLRFVVFTDHGDGTRPPDSPAYRSGVLTIDAIEISTDGGHVVAVGAEAAPYPLAGAPGDVVDDVHRLGGLAFAAHPWSEKAELRWTDWSVPIDGLEWLNGDSEWRDESPWALLRVLMTYPARPEAALGTLLDRPAALLARWDALLEQRTVVAVAGADAHARLDLLSVGEPYDSRASFRSPSYQSMFRTFSTALDGLRLTGSAPDDAAAVITALRSGRAYSVVDVLGSPASLDFTASAGEARAAMGEVLAAPGQVTFRARATAATGAQIVLVKDGADVSTAIGPALDYTAQPGPGVYRIEVRTPSAPGTPPVPWMVSNPIYVRNPARRGESAPLSDVQNDVVRYDKGEAHGWRIEASAESRGAIDVVRSSAGDDQLLFRYALGGRPSSAPFVALVMPAGDDLAGAARLQFVARANRPMRASVQLRVPRGDGRQEARWHRSVYLDTSPRNVVIPLAAMAPRSGDGPVSLAAVDAVLFVVDTVNTAVGTSGQLWLDRVGYGR